MVCVTNLAQNLLPLYFKVFFKRIKIELNGDNVAQDSGAKAKDTAILFTLEAKQKLQENLPRILFRASEQSVETLMEAILKADIPDLSLAAQLLSEKCSINEILMALLYCRSVALGLDEQSLHQGNNANVKKMLLYFDRFTVWVTKALEEKHSLEWKQLQAQLLQEKYQHRLSRAVHAWSKDKQVTIYNYYKEMPVSAVLTLLKVETNSLTVKRNKDLSAVFVASEQHNKALIRMPNSEFCLELIVEDAMRETIHLRYGKFILLDKEKRRDIRVLAEASMQATLIGPELEKLPCHITDLSASGLGLSFQQEIFCQVGDAYAFSLWNQGMKTTGKGFVAWLKNTDGHCTLGLSLEYDQLSHHRLSREVLRRTKAILLELKLHGTPDCLLAY